ncbi:MAG: SAM-dependent methyltransferase [Clostridiales bacterium]|nr:SAM-dependent methyltransferase [Clostridiales bacterium]
MGKEDGEFYTPASVVKLIAEMIEPCSGTVYEKTARSSHCLPTVFYMAFAELYHTAPACQNGAERAFCGFGGELCPVSF